MTKAHPRRRTSTAFTLIELLVVISIIAILIAMTLPMLAMAKVVARDAQCMSNSRQIGLAMFSYQAESEEYFPTYYAPFNGPTNHWWPNRLWRMGYLPPTAFECPSFERGIRFITPAVNGSSLAYSHYGYNWQNIGASERVMTRAAGSLRVPARSSEILKPSETLMVMDSVNIGHLGAEVQLGYSVVPDSAEPNSYRPYGRHAKFTAINITWADGHGSSMKIRDPLDMYNDRELTSRYLDPNLWDRK